MTKETRSVLNPQVTVLLSYGELMTIQEALTKSDQLANLDLLERLAKSAAVLAKRNS